jgi:RND superfamily putative drug exporter
MLGVIAMFGIGLASAVALDAFVLRTLLVPALMHVLGDANWWLPSWLERRLPHLSIEPPECRATIPDKNGHDNTLMDALVKERKQDVRDIPG